MIELATWLRTHGLPDRPWLLLGKGPSFAKRADHDLASYNTMSLNHVVLEQDVDVAHILDWEVGEAVADALADRARLVLMPRHPNISFRPSALPLEELLPYLPALQELDEQGRLVVYARAGVDDSAAGPHIRVQYFSAEAALDVIGHLGAREVRTLGIDGGTAYAQAFEQSTPASRLANGQPSFDRQSRLLRETATRHRLRLSSLGEPLRVFVGVDETQLLAAEVLEHSIRAFSTRPVEVTQLTDVPAPTPRDPRNQPRTAFSFSRFHIPALCGYQGRALYLDADMQVFDDIAKLWEIDFAGAKVLCTNQPDVPEQWKDTGHFHPGRQMSVMMLDCAALPWDVADVVRGLDEGRYTYEQLMFEMCLLAPDEVQDRLPPSWNHLEHYEPGETQLLHYTVVPTQPWKNDLNPLRGIWEQAFTEAWRDHAIADDLLASQIRRGHVKASLRALAPARPKPAPRPATSAIEAELRETRRRLDSLIYDAARIDVRRHLRAAVRRRLGRSL
jgi:hypothetical protein